MAINKTPLRVETLHAIMRLSGDLVAASAFDPLPGGTFAPIATVQLTSYFESVARLMEADSGDPPGDFKIQLNVYCTGGDGENDLVIPQGRYPGLDINFRGCGGRVSIVKAQLLGDVWIALENVGSVFVRHVECYGTFALTGDNIVSLLLQDAQFKKSFQSTNKAATRHPPLTITGSCRFEESSVFGQHWINGDIRESTFRGPIDFSHAALMDGIGRDLHVIRCFADGTKFERTIFEGDVNLRDCTFEGRVSFAKAEFRGGANFDRSSFDSANLQARFQGGRISLNDCRFRSPPDISATDFIEASFLSFRGSTYHSWSSDEDLQRYRRLRTVAGDRNDTFYQNEFFAHEQRTNALLAIKRNPLSITALVALSYDCFSFYGQRFVRPLLVWAGLNAAFWLLFWKAAKEGFLSYRGVEIPPWIEVDAYLAVVNAFLPFTAIRDTSLQMTSGLLVASIFQSTFSLALVALTLLAVRRRFSKGADS